MIARSALLKVAVTAGSAAPKRSTTPLLTSLRIECDGKELRAVGTDLSTTVQARTPCSMKIAACLVDASMLVDRIRSLPDGDINIVVEKGTLKLSAGARRLTISTASADEFPTVRPLDSSGGTDVPAAVFLRLLTQGSFAMANDTTRPHLNGTFLQTVAEGEKQLTYAYSTDGNSGARAVMAQPLALPAEGILVSMRSVEVIRRFVEDAESIRIREVNGDVIFAREDAVLSARLLSDSFPPLAQMIALQANRKEHVLRLPKARLAESVKVISAHAEMHQVLLETVAGGLRIAGMSKRGEESEDIVEGIVNGTARVALSGEYMTSALAAADGEDVELRIAEAIEYPILVIGETTTSIVMPILTERYESVVSKAKQAAA
jgi:DNA polymerase III sliding clamp (beta) subunit (PCNA family)